MAIACLDRSICLRHFTGPLIGSLILAFVANTCSADEPDHPLAREILKELVAVTRRRAAETIPARQSHCS